MQLQAIHSCVHKWLSAHHMWPTCEHDWCTETCQSNLVLATLRQAETKAHSQNEFGHRSWPQESRGHTSLHRRIACFLDSRGHDRYPNSFCKCAFTPAGRRVARTKLLGVPPTASSWPSSEPSSACSWILCRHTDKSHALKQTEGACGCLQHPCLDGHMASLSMAGTQSNFGHICYSWNDTGKISMAFVQRWHA